MKNYTRLAISLSLVFIALTSFTGASFGGPPQRPTTKPSFFPEEPSQSPRATPRSTNRPAPQATPHAQSQAKQASTNDAAAMANEIGLKVLENLHKQCKADENIVVSPTSIGLALAMTLNGADGNTLKEMATALDVDPAKLTELNTSVAALLDELVQGDPDAELSVANAVFVKKDAPFEQEFLLALKKQYQAKAKGLDFAKDPKGAVKEINNWVKKETNDKITSLFDKLPPETQAVIANAVYFKGTWTKAFDEKLTAKRDFNLSSSSKKVDTMQRSGSFVYMETPEFQAVRLPYGTGRFGMFVILPKGNDVGVILPELSAQKWTQHRQNFTSGHGQLYLPKFKLELKYELNATLKKTGIKEAFSDTLADFGKMLKLTPPDRVKIDKVVHKIYIDVNEKNTEAAAVTGVAMVAAGAARSPVKPFIMDCNKPFVILIQDRETGAVLFSGVIANPAP